VQELEWFFKDRTQWGPGAWDKEPDKAQWTDAETGLPCLIHRNYSGAWCGYVGVSLVLMEYLGDLDIETLDISVHGGITFTDKCMTSPTFANGEGICHVPEQGEPDAVFWFGFDCSHYMDMCPADIEFNHLMGDYTSMQRAHRIYRDMSYVKAECASLAKQLIYIG